MACPAVYSGDAFLTRILANIDCQAQELGSFGFAALAAPGSPTAAWLTALLTLFIALFGYRLLFGPAPAARDVVGDVLKIGIVLTLALSWPAWRVLAYDLVLHGPAEIAAAIAPASLGDAGAGLVARLQEIERAIQALTSAGAGRNVGALLEGDAASGGFAGAALNDDEAFGSARLAFLAGTIAPLAILRILGGTLLAIAPLVAGLLLFGATRGIFAGWLRGLVFVFAGSLVIAIVLGAEAAILESWLSDALRVRSLGYALPSAPIELLAITTGFAIASLGLLVALGWVAFYRGWPTATLLRETVPAWQPALGTASVRDQRQVEEISRASRIAESVCMIQHHENSSGTRRTALIRERATETVPAASSRIVEGRAALGSSWKRTSQRSSTSHRRRDAAS